MSLAPATAIIIIIFIIIVIVIIMMMLIGVVFLFGDSLFGADVSGSGYGAPAVGYGAPEGEQNYYQKSEGIS